MDMEAVMAKQLELMERQANSLERIAEAMEAQAHNQMKHLALLERFSAPPIMMHNISEDPTTT